MGSAAFQFAASAPPPRTETTSSPSSDAESASKHYNTYFKPFFGQVA